MNGMMTPQIQSMTPNSMVRANGRVVGACLDPSGSGVLVVCVPGPTDMVQVAPTGVPMPSDARCVAVLAGQYGPLCVWAWA